MTVTAGTVLSYTVGVGGHGGDDGGSPPSTDGADTTCSTYSLTAGGGKKSLWNDELNIGAGGTLPTGGDTNLAGAAGYSGPSGGSGGNGANGGAGGSGEMTGRQNGSQPGGGGGGGFSGGLNSESGGAGGDGQVVLTYIAP